MRSNTEPTGDDYPDDTAQGNVQVVYATDKGEPVRRIGPGVYEILIGGSWVRVTTDADNDPGDPAKFGDNA